MALDTMENQPLYTRWVRYYDALHAFMDYESESARLTALIHQWHPSAQSLLDIACGTGQHLRHLRAAFDVEGLDANDEFLDALRSHSPGVPVHCSKMQDLDLERRFDVITCLFSSIGFVRTLDSLHSTIAGFAAHLNPGGLVIIEPWFSRDNFWTGKVNAHFVDQPGLKIAWMYTTAIRDGLSVLANHIVVGTPAGMETMTEDHVLGLFSPSEYLEAMRAAGLEVVFTRDPEPEFRRGLHIGRLPA